MSAVDVKRCVSAVAYVFAADQTRTAAPFQVELSESFAKRFGFAEVLLQPGERLSWMARKGVCVFGPDRKVMIETAQGNENELGVHVDGPTADALDVLRELWTALGELVSEAPQDLNDSLGSPTHSTMAVVKLPKSYKELFPALGLLEKATREGLGASVVEPDGGERFHIDVRMKVSIGGLTLERQTVIEPRFTAKTGDLVYHTTSPLRSEQHIAMLERLCDER